MLNAVVAAANVAVLDQGASQSLLLSLHVGPMIVVGVLQAVIAVGVTVQQPTTR
jgi:hypothetical protein